MGIKDWLKYNLFNFYLIDEIKFLFRFYTESGNEIADSEVRLEIPTELYNLLLQCSWEPYLKIERELKEMFGDRLNKECENRLKQIRMTKKVRLEDGMLIPGKFICKCAWDVDVHFREATYEDYKRLKKCVRKC